MPNPGDGVAGGVVIGQPSDDFSTATPLGGARAHLPLTRAPCEVTGRQAAQPPARHCDKRAYRFATGSGGACVRRGVCPPGWSGRARHAGAGVRPRRARGSAGDAAVDAGDCRLRSPGIAWSRRRGRGPTDAPRTPRAAGMLALGRRQRPPVRRGGAACFDAGPRGSGHSPPLRTSAERGRAVPARPIARAAAAATSAPAHRH